MTVRVAAVLSHQHRRLVRPKCPGHDRMKCPKPIGVGCAWRQGDVHRTTLCPASADLVGKARSWKQVRRRLVQADGHYPWLVVENRLNAVAVVDVDVDIADPLAAVVEQPTDGNGNVVVDAETAGVTRHRVMESTTDVARALRVTGPDPPSRLDTCHRDPGRDLMH